MIKIKRIDKDKNVDIDATMIKTEVGGNRFTLTPDIDGGLRVHKDQMESSTISIQPCCANEITIK